MKKKDWITLIGLIPLLFLAYLGQLYYSLGDSTETIVTLGIWTVGLALLFWGALFGRKRKNAAYAEYWNIGGWIFTGLFLLCGAYYFVPKAAHFMYVNEEKDYYSQRISNKLQQMDLLYDSYKKQASNRAQQLYDDIAKSLTAQEFSQAFPNCSRTVPFANTQRDSFEKILIGKDYYDQLDSWNNVRSQIETNLVNNWNIFLAPENVKTTVEIVKDNVSFLKDRFKPTNAVEDLKGMTPVLDTKSLSDIDKFKEVFTTNEVSPFGVTLAIFLLILSSASIVFIPRDRIQRIKDDPVFNEGFGTKISNRK